MQPIQNTERRESNFELLRILSMLAIIAHHSIVNSTVIEHIDFIRPNLTAYFLMLWGMWGKTAINCFILISGYFLCMGKLTWQRYVKLLLEIYFYMLVTMVAFWVSGYESMSPIKAIWFLLHPFHGVNNGFTSSFLAFYLFVPIYNALIHSISKKQFRFLLVGLLSYFTIASTFFNAQSMYEPLWYTTLYFIAAYIRIYPSVWSESRRLASVTLAVSTFLAIISVASVMYVSSHPTKFGLPASLSERFAGSFNAIYWFVSDSNKLLALIVGLSAFLVAKNSRKFYSEVINWFAAGTFAVLLIHAASDTMRQWLWQDVCQIPLLANAPLSLAVPKLILIPMVIFVFCSAADSLRRRFIEKPIMHRLNK